MKTKLYYLVAGTLIFVGINANAEQGSPFEYVAPAQKTQKVMEGDTGRKNTQPFTPQEPQSYPGRAEGQPYGCPFLEDVRVYNVGGAKSLALGYISGQAATEVGYMGFKVGDKVKWDGKMGGTLYDNRIHTDFTGTVDLLDSDKCYIKVDNCNKVAVKLYEDLTKINW